MKHLILAGLLLLTACSGPPVRMDPVSNTSRDAETHALLLVIAAQNLTEENRKFLCAVVTTDGARKFLHCDDFPHAPERSP